jgi:hypothetical protein
MTKRKVPNYIWLSYMLALKDHDLLRNWNITPFGKWIERVGEWCDDT